MLTLQKTSKCVSKSTSTVLIINGIKISCFTPGGSAIKSKCLAIQTGFPSSFDNYYYKDLLAVNSASKSNPIQLTQSVLYEISATVLKILYRYSSYLFATYFKN